MKLTIDQKQILKNGELDGNKFYLQGQLDRKQYTSINEVLETIGFKRSRKDKAHVADCTPEELKDAIEDIIETGEVETLKETIKKFQFYETPIEVAEYLIELADVQENDYVLEPSAGHGAIAGKLRELQKFVCVEIDGSKIEHMKERLRFGKNTEYVNMDFLDYKNTEAFDKIIANPPFSKSQDVKHILHMYSLLNEGGRLVSVASSSIKWREGKLYDELKALNPEFIELPEGSFKDSGTMVSTVIVLINK